MRRKPTFDFFTKMIKIRIKRINYLVNKRVRDFKKLDRHLDGEFEISGAMFKNQYFLKCPARCRNTKI